MGVNKDWVTLAEIARKIRDGAGNEYVVSQSAGAGKVVGSKSTGLIETAWLPNSIRGFENPIDTVAYYNQTGNDYSLQVGEVAKIIFSDTTNVPLRIATQSDTEYMMWIIPSNTGGTSGGTPTRVRFNPNNATYASAFYSSDYYRQSDTFAHEYSNLNSFSIGYGIIHGNIIVRNLTTYKGVMGFVNCYGLSYGNPMRWSFASDWRDTTTLWTSLGTVVFPQNSSGYVLVQRIL